MTEETKTKTDGIELGLKNFLEVMRLDSEPEMLKPLTLTEIESNLTDREKIIGEDQLDYFHSLRVAYALTVLLENIEDKMTKSVKDEIMKIIARIDELMNVQIDEIIHNDEFRKMEALWRTMEDLVLNTNMNANIMIDFIDVTKDELFEDFESNSVDIASSSLFKKIYVAEYDQYGGTPYGCMIGAYEFKNTPGDKFWLETMGKIAAASHAPFVSSVSPKFFGCDSIEELSEIKDIQGLLSNHRYNKWDKFRDSEEGAYIGLTLPRFIVRDPYHHETNPCGKLNYTERVDGTGDGDFLWGNGAFLFARNLTRSFEHSGWCQYIRGHKGGGLIEGLPLYEFNSRGEDELKVPVEMVIPDYRELDFANAGFIPLVYCKGTANACFFSCQSIKKPKKFKDPKDCENSQLVTNLSYSFSITRIAHYIKCIIREDIGRGADASTIQEKILAWLNKYVTTVVDPDDLTLRHYPFRAVFVEVLPREGSIGWYDCKVAINPHIQFEGMDAELRLDVRI